MLFSKGLKKICLIGFMAVILCLAASPTLAVIRHVPGDYLTIQDGIDAAGAGDTVLIEDGIYSGPGNRDIDFKGKAVTVRSENGPLNCIIDSQGLGRGFYFHSAERADSVLSGFTITNGQADRGGGIYMAGASPTIVDCHLVGNEVARYGGGIYCEASSPVITGCTISSNTTTRYGGGLYIAASSAPNISDCIISDNVASDNSVFGLGGGIYSVDSSPDISDTTFTGNHAQAAGGGVLGENSPLSIINCMIKANSAGIRGGGVGLFSDTETPTVGDSAIINNSAVEAGGLWIHGSSPQVYNSNISGNSSESWGGGIYCAYSSGAFTSCTIDRNSSGQGGGVYITALSDPVFSNCIISNNIASYGAGIYTRRSPTFVNCTVTKNVATINGGGLYHFANSSAHPVFANTIFWNDTPEEIYLSSSSGTFLLSYCNVQGGYPGTGNIDLNPAFVDPANNDFHLQPGCIDAATSDNSPDVDYDDIARWDDPDTADIGAGAVTYSDIGAYEYFPGCRWDRDDDGDVDGQDLQVYGAASKWIKVNPFAAEFGRVSCSFE